MVHRQEFSNTGKALKASLPQQIEIVATPQNRRGQNDIHGAYSTGPPNMNGTQESLNRASLLHNGSNIRGKVDGINPTGDDFSSLNHTMTNFAMRGMGFNPQHMATQGTFPRNQQYYTVDRGDFAARQHPK